MKDKKKSCLQRLMIGNKNTRLAFISLTLIVLFITVSLAAESPDVSEYRYHELTIPILTYHKFCSGESPDEYTINIAQFREHLDYLKNNDYRVISLTRLLECIENNFFPEKPVVITIDDGFKSVYSLAFPILKEYNYPATLYLYTDFVGNNSNQLTWSEIKEMIAEGIEIGSHSLSHTNLLNMKKGESRSDYLNRINKEISLSKTILERNTASQVLSFAYPYGVYSEDIKVLAKEAGYKALLNVNSMNNSIPINAYALNRQIIGSDCSVAQFQAILREKTLAVNDIFPPDGIIINNQGSTVGAILDNPANIELNSLYMRLGGAGLHCTYQPEQNKVSFTPAAPKLLQKRTWIAQITARDSETGQRRKVAWLFTVR